MKKLGIIGYSAMTREILPRLQEEYDIFINDSYENKLLESHIKPSNYSLLSQFDPDKYKALVTIGDPITRMKVVHSMPLNTEYYTFIDTSAKIFDNNNMIGEGSIICANVIITTNVSIGCHSHINLNTSICHDSIIGDFHTTAPGVRISGCCNIGSNVYIGTNSSVKQKINICDNVVIGMNSGVIKNIDISGTYIGTPARYLNSNMKIF